MSHRHSVISIGAFLNCLTTLTSLHRNTKIAIVKKEGRRQDKMKSSTQSLGAHRRNGNGRGTLGSQILDKLAA